MHYARLALSLIREPIAASLDAIDPRFGRDFVALDETDRPPLAVVFVNHDRDGVVPENRPSKIRVEREYLRLETPLNFCGKEANALTATDDGRAKSTAFRRFGIEVDRIVRAGIRFHALGDQGVIARANSTPRPIIRSYTETRTGR